jgi:hypothetical protein
MGLSGKRICHDDPPTITSEDSSALIEWALRSRNGATTIVSKISPRLRATEVVV